MKKIFFIIIISISLLARPTSPSSLLQSMEEVLHNPQKLINYSDEQLAALSEKLNEHKFGNYFLGNKNPDLNKYSDVLNKSKLFSSHKIDHWVLTNYGSYKKEMTYTHKRWYKTENISIIFDPNNEITFFRSNKKKMLRAIKQSLAVGLLITSIGYGIKQLFNSCFKSS